MNSLMELFRGPARYQAETPWGAWSALAATAVVVIAPMLVLAGVVLLLTASGSVSDGGDGFMKQAMSLATPQGVAVLLGSQLISLSLVWWFAGRGGMRKDALNLSINAP